MEQKKLNSTCTDERESRDSPDKPLTLIRKFSEILIKIKKQLCSSQLCSSPAMTSYKNYRKQDTVHNSNKKYKESSHYPSQRMDKPKMDTLFTFY